MKIKKNYACIDCGNQAEEKEYHCYECIRKHSQKMQKLMSKPIKIKRGKKKNASNI